MAIKFKINALYVNEHSELRRKITLDLTKPVEARIIKQKGKADLDIEHNRVIIPMQGNYLICNMYKERNSLNYFLKALTVLTHNQLVCSKNRNAGRFEPYILSLEINEILYADRYFDYNIYQDYLNQPKGE